MTTSGEQIHNNDFVTSMIKRYLTQYGHEAITQLVLPYINTRRQQKIDTILTSRLASLSIAVEQPANPHNAAAVVRSAEACGLMNVHVVSGEAHSLAARHITQGAFHWLDVCHYQTPSAFHQYLQTQEIKLAGAVVDAPFTLNELPLTEPLCVIFGNERRGLSETMLAHCDYHFTIPMYGMAESLNLSVSAAISLYQLTQAKRQQLSAKGELNEHELVNAKALYYARSLQPRLLLSLLKTLDNVNG